MVAAFDYCLHGKGGAAPSIDTAMHGLVDAAARRPPAPRLRHRAGHRRRRRGADQGDLRRPGGVGAVAAARLPARPRHRRDQGGEPAGDRLHPRRPRHHRLGRHQRGVRGQLAGDHPDRASAYLAEHGTAEPFGPALPGLRARCPRPSAAPRPPRWPRRSAGSPRTDQPQVGHFTDTDVVLDFLARAEHPRLAALGTSLPRPLPAHQGQAAGLDLPADARRSRRSSPGCASCTRPTARTTRPTTTGTPTPDSPGDARRRPGDRAGARASACSPSARTSRPPGWPASSTSTRST